MKSPLEDSVSALQRLIGAGEELRGRVLDFLGNWPRTQDGRELRWGETGQRHRDDARRLTIDTRQWFNSLSLTYRAVNSP